MENETKKLLPGKIIKCGDIRAAIWLHPKEIDGKMVAAPSIKISKSYKDKETGEWINTDFMRADDLPKAAIVATEAYKKLRMGIFELKKSQDNDNDDSPYDQTDDNHES